MPGIDVEGILVKEVENAEVTRRENQSSALIRGAKLQRPRLRLYILAAQRKRLLEKEPGTVQSRRLGAPFLQFKVLDGAPKTFQLRKRVFRDQFGNEIQFPALPGVQPKIGGCGAGVAALGKGQ